MKKHIILTILLANVLFFSARYVVFAQRTTFIIPPLPTDPLSVFRTMYNLGPFDITVPTVIKVPIDTIMRSQQLAIQELPSGIFPYTDVGYEYLPVPYYVTSDDETLTRIQIQKQNEAFLSDNNLSTYVQYDIPSEGMHKTTWTLHYNKQVKSKKLWHTFDENVMPPKTVEVSVIRNGDSQILVAAKPVTDNRWITFPEALAQDWQLTFSYNQPLRITELGLELSADSTVEQYTLQFHARPGNRYRLFADSVVLTPIPTEEPIVFSRISNSYTMPALPKALPNPYFRPPDLDHDGIDDRIDNCLQLANPDQRDINNNRIGDACEDFDGDGVMNMTDNCPEHPNRLQQDSDSDGIGDQCDPDESRLTERLSWLPWLGIILGFGIVFGLLAITMKKEQKPHHSTDEEIV